MTVEDTFNLLADAADVRYPTPERENKGLCPAHDDHNNPGLAFTISATTGNLIVHCFARECSLEDIATSIGVHPSAFFRNTKGMGQPIHSGIEWSYSNVLELLKMLPLNYSWEEQQEAVFCIIQAAQDMSPGSFDFESPYHEIPYVIMRDVLLYAYCEQHWLPFAREDVDWINKERTGYADKMMRLIRSLSQETRTGEI